ncbi:MAG: hypothetical protein HQ473_07355 [Cryomorphaceae bacterium]|nr:hypothetical protein [Cryomorphaceae bacterium]
MSGYKNEKGTTRVGDAIRWLAKQGKVIAPEILNIAGTITGIDGLRSLADKINNSDLPNEDKEFLFKQLDADMREMEEISKRWNSDMQSDSWLSKNVRPLLMIFLTVSMAIFIVIDSSLNGFVVKDDWINLLSSLLLLVYGAYFGGRSLEKIQKMKK